MCVDTTVDFKTIIRPKNYCLISKVGLPLFAGMMLSACTHPSSLGQSQATAIPLPQVQAATDQAQAASPAPSSGNLPATGHPAAPLDEQARPLPLYEKIKLYFSEFLKAA